MRDDAPFAGQDPPAALFRYSRNHLGAHPVEHLHGFAELFQADAYAGFNPLYSPDRVPGPVTESCCWAHGRRKFYELADIAAAKRRGKGAAPISPVALEAVKHIDTLLDIEREINGESAERRLAVRRERCVPTVAELAAWMRAERAGLSRHAPVAKAMDHMLRRWDGFTRFLDDGRICLTNNAAERALRTLALGRKSWLFAGSDRGGERAAAMYTLIATAKLNDVDPKRGSSTASPAPRSIVLAFSDGDRSVVCAVLTVVWGPVTLTNMIAAAAPRTIPPNAIATHFIIGCP